MAGPCAGIAAASAPAMAATAKNFLTVSSQIAGIDAAGDAGVGGAFDDGAAVGEYGDLVLAIVEAQREFVGAHLAEACEPGGEFRQIEGALALGDLDGVASAEADGRAAAVIEIDELALAARGACGIAGGDRNFTQRSGPEIGGEDFPAHVRGAACEDFDGFHCLDG